MPIFCGMPQKMLPESSKASRDLSADEVRRSLGEGGSPQGEEGSGPFKLLNN
jgi:hypothetical protein